MGMLRNVADARNAVADLEALPSKQAGDESGTSAIPEDGEEEEGDEQEAGQEGGGRGALEGTVGTVESEGKDASGGETESDGGGNAQAAYTEACARLEAAYIGLLTPSSCSLKKYTAAMLGLQATMEAKHTAAAEPLSPVEAAEAAVKAGQSPNLSDMSPRQQRRYRLRAASRRLMSFNMALARFRGRQRGNDDEQVRATLHVARIARWRAIVREAREKTQRLDSDMLVWHARMQVEDGMERLRQVSMVVLVWCFDPYSPQLSSWRRTERAMTAQWQRHRRFKPWHARRSRCLFASGSCGWSRSSDGRRRRVRRH